MKIRYVVIGVIVLESITKALTNMSWFDAVGNAACLLFGYAILEWGLFHEATEEMDNSKVGDFFKLDGYKWFALIISSICSIVIVLTIAAGVWGTFSWFR